MAIKLMDVDIAQPLPVIPRADDYSCVWVLIRRNGAALGYVRLYDCRRDISPEELGREIIDQLGRRLAADRVYESLIRQLPEKEPFTPSISVVVSTRDRQDLLSRALESLMALKYTNFDVLVVDNAPSDDGTERLLSEYPFRYVVEPRRGHSWARNRGILESKGDIVAFMDDDMTADPHWLNVVADGFADPEVMAVTGLVLPSELETHAQVVFQDVCGGFGDSFEPRLFGPGAFWEHGMYWLGQDMGSHMAFRREVFRKVGMFDVALGLPVGGAEDEDLLHRIVRGGHSIAYCPQAIRFHKHREGYRDLRRQMFGYSKSTFAFLTKCLIRDKGDRRRLIRYALLQFWRQRASRLFGPSAVPFDLLMAEALGAFHGPCAYLQSVRHIRKQKLSREWYVPGPLEEFSHP